ncbi:hypothetical protein CCR75_008729 [Bremia lactucae]|uniref:Uncharacterized protein n=1 Tax=Bremia lactucae TaxID=4779 RepID=A0A976FN72_BRELC|nr:hypothetical protein CCR75_008729 [Bremia lactucae]
MAFDLSKSLILIAPLHNPSISLRYYSGISKKKHDHTFRNNTQKNVTNNHSQEYVLTVKRTKTAGNKKGGEVEGLRLFVRSQENPLLLQDHVSKEAPAAQPTVYAAVPFNEWLRSVGSSGRKATIETAKQRIADEFRAASEHRQRVHLDHFAANPDADTHNLSECKAVEGLVDRRQLAVSFF